MGELVEFLDWDSDFFGIRIGRADLSGADDTRLREIEADARELALDCLFGQLEPTATDPGVTAQRHGHRLVEVGIRFRRPDGPFEGRPARSTVRRGTSSDVDRLGEAISVIAPWSRFGADPRFGAEAALRMHEAWVRRAIAESDERLFLVSEDEHGLTGFSTNVASPVPRIDLMGVVQKGSGASWALMDETLRWADGDLEAGPCAARNLPPLRYLEHCGFSALATTYSFHRWLDEPIPES